ncbi:MAG TPA: histidine kinase [Puia sp.]|nr:histidine kinase [Puia sp.]
MKFFSRYKLHIVFWIVYFIFWTVFPVIGYHTPLLRSFLSAIIWSIGQGVLAYSCIYWLIPRYFNSRRYIVFTMLVLAGLLLSALFILGAAAGLYKLFKAEFGYTLRAEFLYILLGNFYTLFIFVAIKSIRDKIKGDKRTQLLEKEKTENELQFLKSQMNPHFLFNAINSIYVLIRKDPEFAAVTLVKFADMLRYQLYECNADEIPIEKEIVYLDNYIELEKLRKGNAVDIRYNVSGNTCNFHLAPLLIIPFVENAFKYVSSDAGSRNFVRVDLDFQDDLFELKVENTMDDDIPIPKDKSWGGIGLENVKRRLELIYKSRHALCISTTDNVYSVLLTIKIK